MSASPSSATAAPSQKRPLEDPSSPAGQEDQPNAKRPALDKVADGDESKTASASSETVAPSEIQDGESAADAAQPNGTQDGQGDTVVPDAPTGTIGTDTQPILSTNSQGSKQATPATHQDETGWLHIRAVISSAEAATVIGKGGENVTLIRKMSGAKCQVSDYTRGAVERILTVSGLVDAVAKVSLRQTSSVSTAPR
jgi:heterogeneous nuclear rnp K-like protein